MAAYPSIGLKHKIVPVNGVDPDISDAGTVRTVDLGQATVYRITLTHPIATLTERATLQAFYDTYRYTVNTITLAGEVYNITFKSDYAVESVSSAYVDMSVDLIGTK
ncbi:MAG: hypothetical protein ACI9DH_000552 [Halioglobus sp.]|jgi:hypothetical protein